MRPNFGLLGALVHFRSLLTICSSGACVSVAWMLRYVSPSYLHVGRTECLQETKDEMRGRRESSMQALPSCWTRMSVRKALARGIAHRRSRTRVRRYVILWPLMLSHPICQTHTQSGKPCRGHQDIPASSAEYAQRDLIPPTWWCNIRALTRFLVLSTLQHTISQCTITSDAYGYDAQLDGGHSIDGRVAKQYQLLLAIHSQPYQPYSDAKPGLRKPFLTHGFFSGAERTVQLASFRESRTASRVV